MHRTYRCVYGFCWNQTICFPYSLKTLNAKLIRVCIDIYQYLQQQNHQIINILLLITALETASLYSHSSTCGHWLLPARKDNYRTYTEQYIYISTRRLITSHRILVHIDFYRLRYTVIDEFQLHPLVSW